MQLQPTVIRYKNGIDDVHDTIGGHDVSTDDLRVVDEDFALVGAREVEVVGQEISRLGASLDHLRADDVGQQVLLQHLWGREDR